MKFWHMQLHPGGKDKNGNRIPALSKEEYLSFLVEYKVVGLGSVWDNDQGQPRDFQQKMQVGDIVLIRKDGPFALVKIVSDCFENTNDDLWFDLIRKIEVLSLEGQKYKEIFEDIYQNENWYDTLFLIATCKLANNSSFIKFWFSKIMDKINVDNSVNLLKYKKQIIFQGPPGTGKTRLAKQVAEQLVGENIHRDQIVIVQFHPSYSYEDFVRGIVSEVKDGQLDYKVQNKILAEMSELAQKNQEKPYVLIIDEINRANLPSVFGELIYALEYRDECVDSIYAFNGSREIKIPSNLYILGTMNTADRSVGHIDYAIRRRFGFETILPNESVIENENAKRLFEQVKNLFNENYLSSEFNRNDVMLGHSYFIVKDDNELGIKLNYEIKPILREYLKDGILVGDAVVEIEKLHV